MCQGETRIAWVLVPAHLSYTGDHRDRFVIKQIDRCIADLVNALNYAGIRTVSSCCGHGRSDGEIVLADGRTLVVKESSR